MATSWEELTHWKRLWCWEGLGAREEGDDRGWDGWMASLTRWTWVWVNSGSWWWTGRPGVLRFMGSQRVGLDWAADLIMWLCVKVFYPPVQPPLVPLIWTFVFYFFCFTILSSFFLNIVLGYFCLQFLLLFSDYACTTVRQSQVNKILQNISSWILLEWHLEQNS